MGEVTIEELEAEIAWLHLQFGALARAWRGSWAEFDGRQLRDQTDEILSGIDSGTEFYHDHITDGYGDGPCPIEHNCKYCTNADKEGE